MSKTSDPLEEMIDDRSLADDNTPIDENTLIWVAHYLFVEKKRPADIHKILLSKHGIKIKLQDVYNKILRDIIKKNWLILQTPEYSPLMKEIDTQAFQLDKIRITSTSDINDVASHAAYMIRDLLIEKAVNKPEIHIGFSGGNTTRKVFQKFVQCLMEPSFKFSREKTIVCHALVAGFDDSAPGTDPSSFFIYLDDCDTSDFFNKKFVQFHAPAFVPAGELKIILALPALNAVKEQASRLDLIVTSAATFNDRHSQLRQYYFNHHRATLADLEKKGCIGDMLWLPLNAEGPIGLSEIAHRPVTLLELEDLPGRIRKDLTNVLLVIGPCCAEADARCPKTPILKTILNLQKNKKDHRYITHLVLDKATAHESFAIGAGQVNQS